MLSLIVSLSSCRSATISCTSEAESEEVTEEVMEDAQDTDLVAGLGDVAVAVDVLLPSSISGTLPSRVAVSG